MYDFESDESDYSYEYSDVEYNTLDPYDYDLNNFKNDKVVEDTPEEKLLAYIDNGDLSGVKSILPKMVILEDQTKFCNGVNKVAEAGDIPSDYSDEEVTDDEEEDTLEYHTNDKVKEIYLKGGDTPLMVAAAAAYPDIIECMLSIGLDVNYCLPNSNKCALLTLTSNVCVGWRYINNSWRLKAPKCLKLLIDAGANVKVKGYLTTQESGYTALHYAALSDYWEMIDLLINAGADVDALSNQRESALMLAASKGFVASCNSLLLAGANALLTDRNGSNAAYLASVEGHKTLSDSISIFSGTAQHNADLYKIWSQYTQKDNNTSHMNVGSLEIKDNISNTCIESFCLALDAPYLVTILQEQGVTICDLKLMSPEKLKEIGVSEEDCTKITTAMQDFTKRTDSKSSTISFEYGNPLKIVSIIEMVGNLSEHLELIDTNLDSWYNHLARKYQPDNVIRKTTIRKLTSVSETCVARIHSLADRLQVLKATCDRKTGHTWSLDPAHNLSTATSHASSRSPSGWARLTQGTVVTALSLATGTLLLAVVAKRIINSH